VRTIVPLPRTANVAPSPSRSARPNVQLAPTCSAELKQWWRGARRPGLSRCLPHRGRDLQKTNRPSSQAGHCLSNCLTTAPPTPGSQWTVLNLWPARVRSPQPQGCSLIVQRSPTPRSDPRRLDLNAGCLRLGAECANAVTPGVPRRAFDRGRRPAPGHRNGLTTIDDQGRGCPGPRRRSSPPKTEGAMPLERAVVVRGSLSG
jgi:hypothetical protein